MPVFRVWAQTIPLLGVFIGIAVLHQIFCIRTLPFKEIIENPVVAILIIVIVMGVRPSLYNETRYSYFIFPLLLCIAIMSVSRIVEAVKRFGPRRKLPYEGLAIATCISLFAMSEDFHAFHICNIHSDVISFRIDKYDKFSNHWYPRWDFKSVANLLNDQVSRKSVIILSRDVDTLGFYLEKNYVLYWPRDSADFAGVSRDAGTRELWSGKKMISTNSEIIEIAEAAQEVWLVFYPMWRNWDLDPESVWPGRVQNVVVSTPGLDKRIEVLKIEIKPAMIGGNIKK
jgi:hypothetical protein